jgi:uncharacterized protein YlxW (UPF0749 family)
MDLGLVNAFLGCEPANDTERLIQVNVRNLNENLNKLAASKTQLEANLKAAEQDVLKLSGALENQLSMAEFLAKQKGLEPVQPKQEQAKEPDSVE